jgi:hypothetical protein
VEAAKRLVEHAERKLNAALPRQGSWRALTLANFEELEQCQ